MEAVRAGCISLTVSGCHQLCVGCVATVVWLQESSERDVLYGLTGRIEQVLESSRKADWTPSEPLPSAQSPWVNSLLSYLQVCVNAGSLHPT